MHNLEGMAVFINITDEVNNRPYSTIPGRDTQIEAIALFKKKTSMSQYEMLVAKSSRLNEPWPPLNDNTLLYISWQMVFLHVLLQDKSVRNPGIFLQQQNLRWLRLRQHLTHEIRTKLYGRVLMNSMEPLRHNSPSS